MEKKSTVLPSSQTFTWQVHGRCMPKQIQGTTPSPGDYQDGIIPIQEQVSPLGMNPRPRNRPQNSSIDADMSFGVPVDATLALTLIKAALDKTSSFSEHKEKMNDEDADFLDQVLSLNYGITFNKGIILKILSQPNCEALRSYLCKRETPDNKNHYSLVMVGVDKDGFDLNYYDTTSSGGAITAASQMDTESLLAEYGYPPGGGGGGIANILKDKHDEFDQHYVLLNLANKI
jgi:hypothetical protein